MHIHFWINYVGLTVRTGTAAVGCVANGVGMLGVGQQVGLELGQGLVEGWSRVWPELGQKVKPGRKWFEIPLAELGSRTSGCRVAK